MKVITAFKTDDGRLFEDRMVANSHQVRLQISALLSKFNGTWSLPNVEEFLVGHQSELISALCVEATPNQEGE